VPVVVVVVVDGDVLVVGPPALLADKAIARPAPVKAITDKIIVVSMSQFSALCTPAGFPGAKVDESANALVVQSANDIAKQRAFFILRFPLNKPLRRYYKQLSPATQRSGHWEHADEQSAC